MAREIRERKLCFLSLTSRSVDVDDSVISDGKRLQNLHCESSHFKMHQLPEKGSRAICFQPLKIPASPTNIHYQLRWKGKLSTSGSCKHSETEKLLYRGLSKSERYTSTFWMVCMDNQSIKKLDNNYMHAAQQYCP
uniref:Uncharacterized protein n=1 Tax=Oryza glaberrima TaxID=4538 RepID=I1P465_ORYGL